LLQDASNAEKAHPTLAFAFGPFGVDKLFARADADRLRLKCRMPNDLPIRDFSTAEARALLAETEILVTGWGCPMIDAAVLDAAPKLRMIAHAAGSVKHFIAPEVFKRGVFVTNAADANAVPVAEFTLAAILFANKQAFRFHRDYARKRSFIGVSEHYDGEAGNWEKRVGIIGASRIGRRVIELLRPFGVEILLHDPLLDASKARRMGVTLVPLEELMASCDTISIHAPLLASTRGMIDAGMLARMRDGATLINTARGGIVDGEALQAELVSGRLWAILDVTEPETPPTDSPLYTLENVLMTPHIAGAIGNERHRLGRLAVEEIERYLAGEPLRHSVTVEGLLHQA